jgi:hypothetical protein
MGILGNWRLGVGGMGTWGYYDTEIGRHGDNGDLVGNPVGKGHL